MSTSQSKKEIITIIGEWLWNVIGRIVLNGIVLSPFLLLDFPVLIPNSPSQLFLDIYTSKFMQGLFRILSETGALSNILWLVYNFLLAMTIVIVCYETYLMIQKITSTKEGN